MKLVYEASNTIEGHMILNLLEQAGLSGRVDGDYLQGGMGDLQAIGVIRVMVEDKDYDKAKVIIEKWDSKQEPPKDTIPQKKESRIKYGVIGILIGVSATFTYYNTPVMHDGIDHNGDGKLDEKWTYVNNRLYKVAVDRNFDGKTDFIIKYDRYGITDYAESDDDFNGSFETETYYGNGSAQWVKSDITGDGFMNYRQKYNHGVLVSASYYDAKTKKLIKKQKFNHFRLISASVDSNGDGTLDTTYEYDETEELVSKSNK